MAPAHILGILLYISLKDVSDVAACHRSDTVVRTESRWIYDFGPFLASTKVRILMLLVSSRIFT